MYIFAATLYDYYTRVTWYLPLYAGVGKNIVI